MGKKLSIVRTVLFWTGLYALFWQYFEFAYELWEVGIIESPIWSGTFGFPVLHHGYFGALMLVISYFLSEDVVMGIKHYREKRHFDDSLTDTRVTVEVKEVEWTFSHVRVKRKEVIHVYDEDYYDVLKRVRRCVGDGD